MGFLHVARFCQSFVKSKRKSSCEKGNNGKKGHSKERRKKRLRVSFKFFVLVDDNGVVLCSLCVSVAR